MAQEIKILVSHKLDAYLAMLVNMDGFGGTRGEVIQNFVWHRVNELIANKRISEIVDQPKPAPSAAAIDYCGNAAFCDCVKGAVTAKRLLQCPYEDHPCTYPDTRQCSCEPARISK